MRKFLTLTILGIFACLSLTSCYDATEIDEQAYVLTIGIDQGISNKWRLTLQMPLMKGETGSGMGGGSDSNSGQQDGYDAITVDAPSFFTGLNMIETSLPRKLNFQHTKFIVISEAMAKSGKLGEFFAPIVRYRQIRRTAHVIVTKGQAGSFIDENKTYIGSRLSKAQELIFLNAERTSYFPHVTLEDLYDGFKSTYRQPVAILGGVNEFKSYKEEGKPWGDEFLPGGIYYAGEMPRKGGNKTEFFGSAVFDGDTMVGELNGDETRMMLIGRGKLERGFFTIPDPVKPEYVIPIDVNQEKEREVKIQLQGKRPIIHLKVALEGDILAVQSRVNYESSELKPVLERAVEQNIKSGLDEVIKKSKSMKADIMQFGRVASWQFATIPEWEKYFWIKQYENAEITTEVEFTVNRTGTMLKSTSILATEGKE